MSTESTPRRSIDDDSVAVLIVNNDHSLEAGAFSRIILCVWNDGYCLWSGDGVVGCPPYFQGNVPVEKIASLKKWISTNGYLAIPDLRRHKLGPSGEYISITLREIDGEAGFEMRSWHENWESDESFVTLSDGPEKIVEGQTKLGTLEHDSKAYLFFRLAWSELRNKIDQMIPNEGKPAFGTLNESDPKNRIWESGTTDPSSETE